MVDEMGKVGNIFINSITKIITENVCKVYEKSLYHRKKLSFTLSGKGLFNYLGLCKLTPDKLKKSENK